jgi:membrane fusion protein (multidrug efflux system)
MASPLKTVPSADRKPVDDLREDLSGASKPLAHTEAAAKRPARARLVFVGLAVAAALVAGGVWLFGRGKESTDDAQVEGRVISVAARVAGLQVAKVLVQDNQKVAQGDLLVELDKNDMTAKVAGARADLLAAKAALATAETQLSLTQANAAAICCGPVSAALSLPLAISTPPDETPTFAWVLARWART